MTTRCQSCAATQESRSGRCAVCGGVAIYTHPWQTPGGGGGVTPLVTSRVPGLEGLRLKVEGSNPSGSFKDRVMATLVAEAVAAGAPAAVVASSGNAAVAAASACARADLPLLVLVPDAVSPNAVRQVALRGATVVRGGEGPAAVHGLAAELADRHGLYNLASTFGAAGCEWACRGIGHELAAQTTQPIRQLAASISVGPVLVGAAHGLVEAGLPQPELVAAQAAGCAPIARAAEQGATEVMPWTGVTDTAALAIADRLTGYADEATYALLRIRSSGGRVDAVDDTTMLQMRWDLARYDGLDVELASAAAPAVLRALGGPVHATVCILTGAGVKETLAGQADLGGPDDGPSLESFVERAGLRPDVTQEVTRWNAR